MDRLSAVAADVKALAQESLGQGVVQDVKVADYIDESGDDAYQVQVVVNAFDPNVLTAKKRSAIAISLVRKLSAAGDERFPFMTFIPSNELTELAAND